MSRTYRKYPAYYKHGNRTFYDNDSLTWREYYDLAYEFINKTVYGKKQRDKKIGPPKWFKTMKRRIERAKVHAAIQKKNYDNIPKFKRSDRWDWW